MTNFKRGLSLLIAALMMISSLSVPSFAQTDVTYSVETYLMDTSGNYSSVPSRTEVLYATMGVMVSIAPEEIEGFTFDSSKSLTEFIVSNDGSAVGTLYYSRNQYKATYYYEDLLGPQNESSLVYYGAAIPDFEANPSGKPAKQGYNFIMWSLEENVEAEVPSRMPAKDINMYPIYEIKTYTYTFDAGEGGTFANGDRTISFEYQYGDVPEFPDEIPTMEHMEFIDWDNNLPDTVTRDLTFNALYNELTYAAIFMDGDEEVGYLDGYYYGDFIEDVDIPEGYDSWTLSDGTYVEFPYEIKGNTVFYAAESPSYYTATFYLDEATDYYEEFSILQGDEIDYPADPEKTGYYFVGWQPELTVMPDADVAFYPIWEPIVYTVVFDTNGADDIEPLSIRFGETINLPSNPQKDGFVFLGWEGMPSDGLMPADNITLIAKWEKAISENYLGFKTEIYTLDEASGEWIVAEKVERGEKVKARIFIETGFAVGTGQVLCFFNEDVFECEKNVVDSLVVNTSATSTTGKYRVTGNYSTPSKSHENFSDLVYFGYISEEFLDKHAPLTFTFSFASFKCHAISGDEWFAEFELTAKDDAAGVGNFFVVPETIVNSENGYFAYINLTKGIEGGSSLSAENMISWNPDSSVKSNPVSTGYGKINLDANGGSFLSTDSGNYTIDLAKGETVEYETPVRDGYKFNGWEPSLPSVMPEEVLYSKATWVPCNDTPFKLVTHYYDFSSTEEGVFTSEEFEYTGITGYNIKLVENAPSNPDDKSVYLLLSDYEYEYNILDADNENNVFDDYIREDGSTVINIYFVPVTHIVIFDSNNGSFVDGDTVKFIEVIHGSLANENQPYAEMSRTGYTFNGWLGLTESTRITSDITFRAEWVAEKYDAIFDANGGQFADGSSEIIREFDYESTIVSPDETPTKSGFAFIGWKDENGSVYINGTDMGVMPLDGKTFTAEWVEIINNYEAVFNANGGQFADGTDVYRIIAREGEEIEVPADPEKEGYIFTGWTPSVPVTMPAGNIVFNAKWTEIPVETTTEPTTTPVTEPTTTEPMTVPTTEPITTEPATTEPVTQPTTTKPATTEPVTEPTTVPVTVHTHSPKTVVVNATCDKAGERYEVCNDCGEKIGSSTVINALGHSAGDWQVVKEATYETEGKKVKKCTRSGCGKILEEAVIPVIKPAKVDLSIKTPSITTIKYGDSIYLHAVVELPEGAKVVWEANNSNFSYSVSTDSMTCLITPVSKGDTEFSAKVVDSQNNVISDICTQKMTSKAGFFQKILAFFRRLFGLTKVYPEIIKAVNNK